MHFSLILHWSVLWVQYFDFVCYVVCLELAQKVKPTMTAGFRSEYNLVITCHTPLTCKATKSLKSSHKATRWERDHLGFLLPQSFGLGVRIGSQIVCPPIRSSLQVPLGEESSRLHTDPDRIRALGEPRAVICWGWSSPVTFLAAKAEPLGSLERLRESSFGSQHRGKPPKSPLNILNVEKPRASCESIPWRRKIWLQRPGAIVFLLCIQLPSQKVSSLEFGAMNYFCWRVVGLK